MQNCTDLFLCFKKGGENLKMAKIDLAEYSYKLTLDDSEYTKSMENAGTLSEGMKTKFTGAIGNIKGVLAGAAIGATIVKGVKSAVESVDGLQNAMNNFANATGKGKDEIDRYKGVLQDIYVAGYGESFDDIAESMALVNQQMGDMSDEELKKTVESAYLLADTFDIKDRKSVV